MVTVHLSGQGLQSITPGTAHLQITIDVIGSGYSVGTAFPPNFYKLGEFRFGTGGFFYPVFYLDGQQIIVDLPPGVDTLGYSLLTQTEITVVEQ